jgi:hypothetical protein
MIVLTSQDRRAFRTRNGTIGGKNATQIGATTDTGNRGVNDPFNRPRGSVFAARRGRSRYGSSATGDWTVTRAGRERRRAGGKLTRVTVWRIGVLLL